MANIRASETLILPTPDADELNLLPETLDVLYGLENLRRVDDNLDQIWAESHRFPPVTTAKAMWASSVPKTFGCIDTTDVFHSIFSAEGFGFDVSGTELFPFPCPLTFRWAIDDSWRSQPGQNLDGSDHMVTWRVTGGPSAGNYVIAWEDQAIPAGDQDFNDLVVEISNARPAELTPILPTPEVDELNLLPETLDVLYGLENLTRVDDAADQIWVKFVGTGSVTAKALWAKGEKIIGCLREPDKPTGDISVPIASYDGFGLDIEARGPGTLPDSSELPVFRWQLDNEWSSRPNENTDCSDRMVTWRVTGGPSSGNYVIAWEDNAIPPSDQDYNDLVVELSGEQPWLIRPVAPNIENEVFELVSTNAIYDPAPIPAAPAGVFRIIAEFRFVLPSFPPGDHPWNSLFPVLRSRGIVR